jgi:hypothetical protein
MNEAIWHQLDELFAEYPMMKGSGVSDAVIAEAERSLARTFDPTYKEFLRRYGAGMVGANPILGLSRVEVMGEDEWNVVDVTHRFRDDGWAGSGGWHIVSTDGSGNPIGIDVDGHVWISDHGTGTIELLADDFGAWLSDLVSSAR